MWNRNLGMANEAFRRDVHLETASSKTGNGKELLKFFMSNNL